jgi:hypothetical protein
MVTVTPPIGIVPYCDLPHFGEGGTTAKVVTDEVTAALCHPEL